MNPRAILAEDEPVLSRALRRELGRLWPELELIGSYDNGPEAAEAALRELPDVLFLDVQMPGASGIDVAAEVADEWPDERALPLLVFVTAFEQYAVQAFERAAIDYLVKPVAPDRLASTVNRLRQSLAMRKGAAPADRSNTLREVQQVGDALVAPASGPAEDPVAGGSRETIRFIRVADGNKVRMIPVDDVVCFEASDKYVTVVTETDRALVRMSLRELASRIEGVEFVQIHRSVLVNSGRMLGAERDELGHYWLTLRGLRGPLKVSRAFSHLFRPM